MLTDEEKQKIRAEEIFRSEVRLQLDGSSSGRTQQVMKFVNSPFGIYLLSTVLIGLISFLYTQWRAKQDSLNARSEQIEKLHEEMAFRVRQLDAALDGANAAVRQWKNKPEPASTDLNQANKTFNIAVNRVPVVVRLGGLVDFPGEASGTEWARFRDIDIQPSLLPFRQGYRAKDYEYESLVDLASNAERILHSQLAPAHVAELQSALNRLDEPSYQLLRFQLWRADPNYALSGQAVKSMHELANADEELLQPINEAWAKAKSTSALKEVERGMGEEGSTQ
jgi:hypothetical protein